MGQCLAPSRRDIAQIAEQPQTRYARSGSVSIAYQVVGDGPRDLVYIGGWVTRLESGEVLASSKVKSVHAHGRRLHGRD